jgi:uncharacterized protein YndB with AHSA1/START domain
MQVAVEQRIRRPPQDVAAFAMNPANDRQWIGALRSVRTLTDGTVGRGTRVERVAGFLGRRIRYVNEITEYEPGRHLAMRSVEAPFPMTVAYDFEPGDDGGTLVRITAGGDPGRVFALAGPVLPTLVKRGIRRDLTTLRRRLEG